MRHKNALNGKKKLKLSKHLEKEIICSNSFVPPMRI